MNEPEMIKVFCCHCNRYTDHIIRPNIKPPKSHKCKLCENIPTISNLKYAEELLAEDQGDFSAHPHFIPPLFRYGGVYLLRNANRIGYAHCVVYGIRYAKPADSDLFRWEYYVLIHGESKFEWLAEEKLNPIVRPLLPQEELPEDEETEEVK